MTELTTIEISKENLKFSAAHFTIFSATDRERLHGHNFVVHLSLTAPVGPNGMCFSYVEIKDRMRRLCHDLDEYMILPAESPHLEISEEGNSYVVEFADERMLFLKSDCLVLPIRNTTVEEYSRYLLTELCRDRAFIDDNDVRSLVVKVSSGPGQWGSASWDNAAA
ncbi:MAG: 6-pyruvoyl tetrahydropterin synthase [Gammaproteobacteria bacterium]|nr:6-carboxytetrahydropterin synthase [Gammaproteobacteria bacterium]NNM01277.1 6-pyruvoyl tetrahydropterin synthase [Gammaproteobacteria bacterium]